MGALLRRLQSRLDYFRFVYRGEAGWLIAIALFVLTLPIVWLPGPLVTGAALIGIAVTVWGLARSGFGVLQLWRSAKFAEPNIPKAQFVEARLVDAQWKPSTAESWLVRHANAETTAIWWDREVNQLLRGLHGGSYLLSGRVSEGEYRLPDRLQNLAGRALRYGKSTGKGRRGGNSLPIRFNGRLLRLTTEPSVEQIKHGLLDFERVTYFDGECSNELWQARELGSDGKTASNSPVHFFACDRAGSFLSLENARVANIVGISMLGITTDSYAVLVLQSEGNSIAPNAWSTSGSGSLEQRDLRHVFRQQSSRGDLAKHDSQRSFNAAELILEGMLRELREESLVRIDEIDRPSAVVTAYWRWTERAMKPEFSGLVRLNLSAAELQDRQHHGGERAFSSRVHAVPIESLFQAVDQDSSGALMELLASQHSTANSGSVLNPSCEVTILAARDFLRSEEGRAWNASTGTTKQGSA